MTHHIMNCSTWCVCVLLLTLYSLILCVMMSTHTVVLVIQEGETALDRARDTKRDEVIKYLEEFGK